MFFKGHDFEYAFLVEPSFSEEYALLIGDGSLTALVADKQVWGFMQADQYLPVQSNVLTFKDPNGDIRPMTMTAMIDMPQSEGRMSRSDVPKTTEHSVSVSESLIANSGINRIVLPEALTGIASMMFDGCGNLEEVDIPANVTRIGAYAFSGTGIRNVAIPDSVFHRPDRKRLNGLQQLEDSQCLLGQSCSI